MSIFQLSTELKYQLGILFVIQENCIKVGDTISVKLDYCNHGMNKISFYKIQMGKFCMI
jgi:hypothetical protein